MFFKVIKMKVLQQTDAIIKDILGLQPIKSDCSYRKSSFSFILQYNERAFVCSTLTHFVAEITDSELRAIQNPSINLNAELYELVENYILVPLHFDELTVSRQIRETATIIAQKNYINSYTVMTTTDCNARCWYCYELGRSRIPMSIETAEKAVNFMISESKKHKIKILWFGGEPLYNSQIIDYISSRLRKSNCEFTAKMISNGYLFDETNISKAKNEWNIKQIQITLDGTENEYNRSKAYIYNEGSAFQKVINNIEGLLKSGIKVNIRMNIGENNCDNIYELTKYLLNKFSDYKLFSAYTAVLMEYDNNKLSVKNHSEHFKETYYKINDMLYADCKNGKRKFAPQIKTNSCMADSDNAVLIAPNGGIGKCEHFSESDFWRTLDDPTVDRKILNEWKKRVIVEECRTCPHFPMCIKLEKCPDTANICTEFDREIMTYHLKKQLEIFIEKHDSENAER